MRHLPTAAAALLLFALAWAPAFAQPLTDYVSDSGPCAHRTGYNMSTIMAIGSREALGLDPGDVVTAEGVTPDGPRCYGAARIDSSLGSGVALAVWGLTVYDPEGAAEGAAEGAIYDLKAYDGAAGPGRVLPFRSTYYNDAIGWVIPTSCPTPTDPEPCDDCTGCEAEKVRLQGVVADQAGAIGMLTWSNDSLATVNVTLATVNESLATVNDSLGTANVTLAAVNESLEASNETLATVNETLATSNDSLRVALAEWPAACPAPDPCPTCPDPEPCPEPEPCPTCPEPPVVLGDTLVLQAEAGALRPAVTYFPGRDYVVRDDSTALGGQYVVVPDQQPPVPYAVTANNLGGASVVFDVDLPAGRYAAALRMRPTANTDRSGRRTYDNSAYLSVGADVREVPLDSLREVTEAGEPTDPGAGTWQWVGTWRLQTWANPGAQLEPIVLTLPGGPVQLALWTREDGTPVDAVRLIALDGQLGGEGCGTCYADLADVRTRLASTSAQLTAAQAEAQAARIEAAAAVAARDVAEGERAQAERERDQAEARATAAAADLATAVAERDTARAEATAAQGDLVAARARLADAEAALATATAERDTARAEADLATGRLDAALAETAAAEAARAQAVEDLADQVAANAILQQNNAALADRVTALEAQLAPLQARLEAYRQAVEAAKAALATAPTAGATGTTTRTTTRTGAAEQ